jgi:hypothetical protein
MSVHVLRTQRVDVAAVDLSRGAQLTCADWDGPVTVTVSCTMEPPNSGGVRVYGDDDHGRHCTVFLLPRESVL